MPDLAGRYFDVVRRLLEKAERTQAEAIERAGQIVAGTIAGGGTLYTFGTGHSHMLAEEPYVRAGGLTRVEAILVPRLMLHEDPAEATELERQAEEAARILEEYGLEKGDTLLVISNSGRNAVPVEMALRAREQSIPVLALTSLRHSRSVSSRHSSGLRLFEVADVVLDNGGVPGDAALEVEGLPVRIGPTSTVVGAALVNAVVATAVEQLLEEGLTPRVFISSNVDQPEGTSLLQTSPGKV
ncbi:MAG: sugar isomerase domain-containing protein [Anaerolineales bacterium]